MTLHQSVVIALTGGIACGKSEAGRIFHKEGFAVLDTDKVAHQLMKSGGPVFDRVVNEFGDSVVGKNGEVDRIVLGSIVFADPSALKTLNGLIHSEVIAVSEDWKKKQNSDAVVIVPLLFETEWVDGWDAVVCVSSDESLVLQRLRGRGLSKEASRQRIAAQMPLREKEGKSDFTIRNNGTLDELYEQVSQVLKQIRK